MLSLLQLGYKELHKTHKVKLPIPMNFKAIPPENRISIKKIEFNHKWTTIFPYRFGVKV